MNRSTSNVRKHQITRRELIGGADITEELFASGELGSKLDEALGEDREQVVKTVVLSPTAA